MNLRSRFGISSEGHGGRRYNPYIFTEQGVAMLSSVLHSKRAIQVNIQIIKTFTRLRELVASNKDLTLRLDDLEKRYDKNFKSVFDAIKRMITEEEKPKGKIGFKAK